jgi:hypothetical protein
MGCPSIAASASMPPTSQPTTPIPPIIGVWLSVPTRVSGKPLLAITLSGVDDLAEVLKVHLLDDPRSRRHDAEVVKACWAHLSTR